MYDILKIAVYIDQSIIGFISEYIGEVTCLLKVVESMVLFYCS